MKRSLPLFMLALLTLGGCRKDEPIPEPATPAGPVVRLTVAPMWNGSPFDKDQIYVNISEERIQLQMLKLYLGDLGLYANGGDTDQVFDVDFFWLKDGPVVRTYPAKAGTYDGVEIGLGVPADLNGMNPAMWSNEDPLSTVNGMYWTWSTMYRFMIFEGRYDTVATTTGTPPFQFSIHTGRNECYRTRSFPLTVTATAGDTTDLRLELDIARFFYSASDTLYMLTESQQHGAIEELPMSEKFSDMVIEAMSLSTTP